MLEKMSGGHIESDEHRIEREKQKIRDRVAEVRAAAQVVRNEANRVLEIIKLGGGEFGDVKSWERQHESLLKQIAGIEAEASSLEMTIRNVK